MSGTRGAVEAVEAHGRTAAMRPRGVTLIEVVVVTAILVIVTMAVLVAMNSATLETQVGTAKSLMENQVNKLGESLVSDLNAASRASVRYYHSGGQATYGNKLEIQVPVDWDADGDAMDANGLPEYGSVLGSYQRLNGRIAYEFVTAETLSEAALDADLNGDGDKLDSVKRGHFTRSAPNSAGATVTARVTDRYFVWGDFDGDGLDDSIFQEVKADTATTTPARVQVDLRALDVVGRQRVVVGARALFSVMPQNE
jgi:prepilin-type N-terminal cleavage/methylation domain-containing protein